MVISRTLLCAVIMLAGYVELNAFHLPNRMTSLNRFFGSNMFVHRDIQSTTPKVYESLMYKWNVPKRAILRLSAKSEESEDDINRKALEAMTAFTSRYTKVTGTYLCSEPSVTAVVIKGLAEHKVNLGAPLCPCRYYEDKEAEVKAGYWNCPCVPMRERHECHCMLFLTEDNDFSGNEQTISVEDVRRLSDV